MSEQQWTAVDRYLGEHLLPPDPVLDEALRTSDAAGLPAINVAPNQGKFLHLLTLIAGARRVLEIGTLGGYSTIWLARALPDDGRLVTLEADPAHAEVAAVNLARAGLAGRVDLRVGKALDTLPQLRAEGAGPFDLVFIDADKPSNVDYVGWALRLARRGTVIVVDNVVRAGRVIDATTGDASVDGTRRLFEYLSTEPRLTATAVQTVGAKGYDGFLLAVVTTSL
ncbi:O-methyltransferase [Jiangella aurantiaca]|uniref:O-methyltransferase n=1 Tax=Jiangella aurantiaca TaxID=2530373 RepID=A0A4V2YS21_9ACTN|nr:O-methyltransferase [Jiangella aurantiaca]TDD68487.1 O-methyltransferase [Jiangella aurantiaca]